MENNKENEKDNGFFQEIVSQKEKEGKEMKEFLEILKDFLSVRSLITMGAFGLAYILMYKGQSIPELLAHIIDLLLGFWFGSKVAKLTNKEDIK